MAGRNDVGADSDFALLRYNVNGSLDPTFGNSGIIITALGAGNDYGASVALQLDGKIVVAGSSYNGINNVFAVLRFNSNGFLDTSFGTDGKVTTTIGNGDYGESVAIQPDGKIVVVGGSDSGSNFDIAVVRYNINGSLDTTFGNGGIVSTFIGTSYDVGVSVAIQPDGKIVVAGYSLIGTNNNFSVARFNNPSLATTFFTQNQFKIYPNPAQSTLHIESQETIKIEKIALINFLGETVLSHVGESLSEVKLNIENLITGMYILQITVNNKTTNNKFIKE